MTNMKDIYFKKKNLYVTIRTNLKERVCYLIIEVEK